jgi:hypothetical protein
MSWITPKTDWDTVPKNPVPEDFNRIEGNIQQLNNDVTTGKTNIFNAIVSKGITPISQAFADLVTATGNIIKATGNATVDKVLAGYTFSNNNANDLIGTVDLSQLVEGNIKKGVNINNVIGTLNPTAKGTASLSGQTSITISGLDFTPTVILALAYKSGTTYLFEYYHKGVGSGDKAIASITTTSTTVSGTVRVPSASSYPVSISGNSFTISSVNSTYTGFMWYAMAF